MWMNDLQTHESESVDRIQRNCTHHSDFKEAERTSV